MSAFELASALRLVESEGGRSRFEGDLPEAWLQGKGAFGGLVIGLLARGLVSCEEDRSRTLRSLNADLIASTQPGPFTVEVAHLRRGSNVSFLEAKLLQNGALMARGAATMASTREVAPSAVMQAQPPPALEPQPPWTEAPVLPVEPPAGPVFAVNYEYRSSGPYPFSGETRPYASGWVREREPPAQLDEAAIVGLMDAWWPTSLTVATRPRIAVTVGFTMQLLKRPSSLDPKEPLYYRAHAVGGGDNYFVEFRELWSGGEVVALNQQTFAMLT